MLNIFIIILLYFFFFNTSIIKSEEYIRVLIINGKSKIYISGKNFTVNELNTGREIAILNAPNELLIEAEEKGIKINNRVSIPNIHLFIDNTENIYKIDGKRYKGRIEILKDNENLLVVNELNLEDYLVGLVAQEMPSHWNIEALKAQAVVGRSYALFQKKNRMGGFYHLESNVNDQVYNGIDSENKRAQLAVAETYGEVLKGDNEEIIQSLYHSCCGGRTEPPTLIWQNGSTLLQSVVCGFCKDYPNYFWEFKISANELKRKFNNGGYQIDEIKKIEIEKRSDSNRVLEIAIKGKSKNLFLSGNELRRLIGFDCLRSTNFIIKSQKGTIEFFGVGYGHGAGLCQWGARKMAECGYRYKDILKYYYPQAAIKKAY